MICFCFVFFVAFFFVANTMRKHETIGLTLFSGPNKRHLSCLPVVVCFLKSEILTLLNYSNTTTLLSLFVLFN